MPDWIRTLEDPQLPHLCQILSDQAGELSDELAWPGAQLSACGEAGVYAWFIPRAHGGLEWTNGQIMRGYLQLSAACLTTTFVITQRMGACRRIASSENQTIQRRLLPDLISGARFATVGISHLTTSRQHLRKPILQAEVRPHGFRLRGQSPWVTGATQADHLVVGATLEDGRQLLAVVDTDQPGVEVGAPAKLVAVGASQTGPVYFKQVDIAAEQLVGGPVEDVMKTRSGAATGGIQTSILAAGLAKAALDYLQAELPQRGDLEKPTLRLLADHQQLTEDLLHVADGFAGCSNEQLRTRANSLVLRATQAALTAAKGAGFVQGHPAGRWCQEALFFLVWSCPQPVLSANLCELAGVSS